MDKYKIPDGVHCSSGRLAQIKEFCDSLGIKMHNYDLMNLALTHTSFAHETNGYPRNAHNERLEFLGDSVLSLIVSTYIFGFCKNFDEGRLTKLRAQVVCETSLYQCAKKMKLGHYLRMGRGEKASGGQERPSILADAFEAVLGAYYLDQGFHAAQTYLLDILEDVIKDVCSGRLLIGDYKSMLQEYLQQGNEVEISYTMLDFKGPEHDRVFTSGVMVNGRLMGKGQGHTKKEAEQHAAREALLILRDNKKV